jgi:hypothetical protein
VRQQWSCTIGLVEEDFLLFAGSASQRLARAIAGYLDRELSASETLRFSEGNLFVRVLENVRGRVSIRARVCADAIEAAGADRVVTLDLHAPQLQGSSASRSRTSAGCRCCATRSLPRVWRISPSSLRMPGMRRRRARGQTDSTPRRRSQTSDAPPTTSLRRSSNSSGPSKVERRSSSMTSRFREER